MAGIFPHRGKEEGWSGRGGRLVGIFTHGGVDEGRGSHGPGSHDSLASQQGRGEGGGVAGPLLVHYQCRKYGVKKV